MGLRLIDDDLGLSFDIHVGLEQRHALRVQIQRALEDPNRAIFESRLTEKICELIDSDLRPPTARQIAYALSIAKALDVPLPGEALRHKGSMFDFLARFAPLYQSRSKDQP